MFFIDCFVLDFPSVNTKGAVAKQGVAQRLTCKKGGRLAGLASLVSLGAALKVGGHLTCKKGGASQDSLRSSRSALGKGLGIFICKKGGASRDSLRSSRSALH